jgi:ATP synthase protein I
LQRSTLTRSASAKYNFQLSEGSSFFKEWHLLSRPIRTVLRWQLIATAALAALGWGMAGEHGALSAALGGMVSLGAGWTAAMVARTGKGESAGGVLVTALKAEGVKLGVIAVLLGLVLATYREVVVTAFIGSFLATMLIFSMAFFVRER